MFRNYLRIALRNLLKSKTSSSINILGLTVGITCCLLIGVYIQHELSYDRFQDNGDRIARVIMAYKFDGGSDFSKGNFTSVRVAPVFKNRFPEIKSAVRMGHGREVVRYQDKLINEKNFAWADSSFFNIFSFPLLQGDKNKALSAPKQVILTASTAKRYFGNENPIGKSIELTDDTSYYQVTGVMADCPSNSQIKFDFLASFSSLGLSGGEGSYWNANYITYLLLNDKKNFAPLQSRINEFMKSEMAGLGATVKFELEPFSRVHLYSEYDGFEANNSIVYIYIMEAVAAMILLIAGFTYVNLNTARSMDRAREVGVRKVMGAGRSQLFWQFIGESVLLCGIATLISMALAALLIPYFNQLTEKNFVASSLYSATFLCIAVLLIVLVSLLAGSYPALVLSNFQPVKVLKGSFRNTASGQWVRKSLIVFQFSISVVLIVSTIIMQQQLHFIQTRKLGYSRDQVLILPGDSKLEAKIDAVKAELKSNNNILSVSACVSTPVQIAGGYNMRSEIMPDNQQIAVTADPIDEDFVKTSGLQLIAGEDLTNQDMKSAADTDAKKVVYHFILNESAAKQLGWTASQAVGKRMFLDASRPGYVKGVVKDFNFESLHNAIKPLVLFPEQRARNLLVKMRGGNLAQTIAFLETKWKLLAPDKPFEYRFMDEDFNKLYTSEIRLGTILNIFAGLAIALACLGLFGLSSYSAKQRIREIGIRKVLGASVGSIVTALSADFVRLVVIAILISCPIAWYLMHQWLEGFSYRVDMNWWIFGLAALVSVGIAIVTVSVQAIQAALRNPVKSLRSE